MKTNQNLRRFGEKKGSNNKISHAEFAGGAPRTSGASTHAMAVNDNNLRGRFRNEFGMTIDNNHAFTLIELLVVVLIIGILAAVALPQYQVAVAKSRYATLKHLTQSIKNAQEVYYLGNDKYTTKFEDLDIELPAGGELNEAGNEYIYPWGDCRLSLTDNNVRCANTQIALAYQIYYDASVVPLRINCYVMDNTNTTAHKVCKAETGKTSPGYTSTTTSSYRYGE